MLIKWIKARMDERDERDHKMKCMESMECMEYKRSNDEKTVHLTESTCALSNPGCGWYHLYSFALAEESFLYIACEEEELVLLRIDIHAFRSCKQIPKEALDWADRILTFFAQHGKGIILRIVYDTDGHGMEHEPSSIAFVKSHMRQLGEVIKAHAGEILVHQGLFVGSWGEMHSSKFLMGGRMEELAVTLAQAMGGTCPIAVRKPVQLRYIENKTAISGTFTLFNDGIFGSETDLGTYGSETDLGMYGTVPCGSEAAQDEKREMQPWTRQDELAWQQTRLQRSFCGGEALGGMATDMVSGKTDISFGTDISSKTDPSVSSFTVLDWHQVAADLAQMHVSYLNSTYRQELLDDWKAQRAVWNGQEMSGYDYIGRHLGYRFTVTCARIINGILQITIRNTGFANLCEEAVCKLILIEKNEIGENRKQTEDNNSIQCFEISCDPRTWDSGTDTTIESSIPQEIWRMQKSKKLPTQFILQLTRKRDGRILAFANEEYDRQFGGVLLEI